RVLPCRGRAEMVRRTERLHRGEQRSDDPRTDEGADPRHRAGVVRPGAMVAVRRVAGRLEPAGVGYHGDDLRGRFPAGAPANRFGAGNGMSPQRPPYLPGDPVPQTEID